MDIVCIQKDAEIRTNSWSYCTLNIIALTSTYRILRPRAQSSKTCNFYKPTCCFIMENSIWYRVDVCSGALEWKLKHFYKQIQGYPKPLQIRLFFFFLCDTLTKYLSYCMLSQSLFAVSFSRSFYFNLFFYRTIFSLPFSFYFTAISCSRSCS